MPRHPVRRVLVVEDDPVQALLVTLLLGRIDVACSVMRDGAQAVDAIAREPFSLFLMDYLMPVLNGVEATRKIRLWEREQGLVPTPIVAVTASAMAEDCSRYYLAGMDGILLKPFTAQQLYDVIARHFSRESSPVYPSGRSGAAAEPFSR